MARFRPAARMVGLSPDPSVVRSMALSWGVEPLEVDLYGTTDEMVWFAVETALVAPGMFDRYAALSPSLWWDDGALARLRGAAPTSARGPNAFRRAGMATNGT